MWWRSWNSEDPRVAGHGTVEVAFAEWRPIPQITGQDINVLDALVNNLDLSLAWWRPVDDELPN